MLLSLQKVSIRFGGPLLLDKVSLQIERGERVGRNGEGKSTLLKLINGELMPDSGDISRKKRTQLKTDRPNKNCERSCRLIYKEQSELATLPQKIEEMEEEQNQLYQVVCDPLFYKKGNDETTIIRTRLSSLHSELEKVYKRWEVLETLQG